MLYLQKYSNKCHSVKNTPDKRETLQALLKKDGSIKKKFSHLNIIGILGKKITNQSNYNICI